MPKDTGIICPHCGASISIHGLNVICEYCGTRLCSNLLNVIEPKEDSLFEIRKRHEYLKINKQYIKSGRHISMIEKSNGDIELTSNSSFYANDGNYCLMENLCINIRYVNKIKSDSMYIITKTSYKATPISQMSVILDVNNLIDPIFESSEGNTSFFRITYNEFKSICDSCLTTIETNSESMITGNFDEFIPYCRRFYNLAFNKNKYSYSLYQNLVSDYGK